MTRWILLVLAAGCLVVVEPDAEEAQTDSNGLPIGMVHPCMIRVKESRAYWTVCFANTNDIKTFEKQMDDNCSYNGVDCEVKCSSHELWICAIECPGPSFSVDACNSSYGCFCPPE